MRSGFRDCERKGACWSAPGGRIAAQASCTMWSTRAGATRTGGADYDRHQGNLVSAPHGSSVTGNNDSVDNAILGASIPVPCLGGPQSDIAREICRGVVRLLAAHGLA